MNLQIKTHLFAFAFGAVLCAIAVVFFTSGDAGLRKLKESKVAIEHTAAKLKDESEEGKKQLTSSIEAIEAETAREIEKAATKVAKLQAENIGLKKQVKTLKHHITIQDGIIYKHEALHAESLVALNEASRAMQTKIAGEKAMKIGISVGVPLLVVGSFVGGFYMAGVVR